MEYIPSDGRELTTNTLRADFYAIPFVELNTDLACNRRYSCESITCVTELVGGSKVTICLGTAKATAITIH